MVVLRLGFGVIGRFTLTLLLLFKDFWIDLFLNVHRKLNALEVNYVNFVF